MARVTPSERFERGLDEVLSGVDGELDPVERVGRLGARLILQQVGPWATPSPAEHAPMRSLSNTGRKARASASRSTCA